jgi:hypothetical protein
VQPSSISQSVSHAGDLSVIYGASLVVIPSALKPAIRRERTFWMRRRETFTLAGCTCLNLSRRKLAEAGTISRGRLNQLADVLIAEAISRRRGKLSASFFKIRSLRSAKLITDGSANGF